MAFPFLIASNFGADRVSALRAAFDAAAPFAHVVIDDFLPAAHARFLADGFPTPDHPVWLDWRKRSAAQYGKQGPGDASKFDLLDPRFRLALQEFNAAPFLSFLESLTGVERLLPDPYFTGGGMHQILAGGILDIHTDFNDYRRLGLYRRLNVLIYLNEHWDESFGGALELWNARPADGGVCIKSVGPVFNRAVIFKTDKQSFHGHPREWNAPHGLTRRSVALYYYTADKEAGERYTTQTDFQNVAAKALPQT
jgi:hypothetical protein